jgi:hypothetical protein
MRCARGSEANRPAFAASSLLNPLLLVQELTYPQKATSIIV